jgi:hypothetical protein
VQEIAEMDFTSITYRDTAAPDSRFGECLEAQRIRGHGEIRPIAKTTRISMGLKYDRPLKRTSMTNM